MTTPKLTAANYQSGIDAVSAVLPGLEDRAAFEALKTEYHDYHQPRSPEARRLCDKLALCEWLERRYARIETELYVYQCDTTDQLKPECPLGHVWSNGYTRLSSLQRNRDANDRAYDRSLKRLHHLEAAHPKDEDAGSLEVVKPAPVPPTPGPEIPLPELPVPDLPTAQPSERKDKTQQLASSLQTTIGAGSLPLSCHPPLEDCPNCRNLGYISPNCHFVPGRPRP